MNTTKLESTSLQRFLELREQVRGRMDATTNRTNGAQRSVAATSTSTRNTVAPLDQGASLQVKVEGLRAKMADGVPVRTMGNFLDIRA